MLETRRVVQNNVLAFNTLAGVAIEKVQKDPKEMYGL